MNLFLAWALIISLFTSFLRNIVFLFFYRSIRTGKEKVSSFGCFDVHP
jgi:hypothetical protein